jgi:hypothetical protein
MNGHERESEAEDHPAPLDSRSTEIEEQGEVESRDLQVVDALRQVLVGELFGAFDLD